MALQYVPVLSGMDDVRGTSPATYPKPPEEEERLAVLRSYGILDTPPEPAFDDIVMLASCITGKPISLITLVEEARQWCKAKIGLDVVETPREQALCSHAIMDRHVLEVRDAKQDERFADNPLVTSHPYIRFYAGAPLITPEGHVLGTLCVIDYKPGQLSETQREALQALSRQVVTHLELRRLRREFETILNSAAEGIYGLDKDGRVTFTNAAGARMVGYEPHELLRQRHHDHVLHSHEDGSPYPWHDCPTYRTLETGEISVNTRDVFWTREGRCFPVEYSSTPIVTESRITGAVVVFRDIRERLEVQKMKDDLVSVVSHELRTPLTSIMGYLDALLEGEAGDLQEEQHEYARIAYRNARKLHGLISDLLTLSRLESGKFQLDQADLDLIALLQAQATEQNPIARDKHVDLVIEAPSSLWVLRGDERRLQQTFANLISNGIKFSNPGSRVTVRVEEDDAVARVCVSDRGVGIPADEVPRLFERFFRASTAGTVEGTGLGLSISKEIVERHGGRIWVESQEGKGSTFFVELPLDPGRGERRRS